MTVATVKAQLASMLINISGVKHVFAQAPDTLDAADMPAFVLTTGPAAHNWEALGDAADIEGRVYLLRLHVLPVGNGIPGEAERQCEPFFASVRDYIAARPMLGYLQNVQSAYLLGDSGVARMALNLTDANWGIEFKLQVQEYVRFTLVD